MCEVVLGATTIVGTRENRLITGVVVAGVPSVPIMTAEN